MAIKYNFFSVSLMKAKDMPSGGKLSVSPLRMGLGVTNQLLRYNHVSVY